MRSNALVVALLAMISLPVTALHAQQAPQTQPQQQQQPQPMPPGHPSKKALLAAEGVMTSANLARGAADVCHLDAAKIARFKETARVNFPDAPDFEAEWKLGLAQAQPTVDRFDKLRTSNPVQYKKEINDACPPLSQGIDEVTQPQPPAQ
ncbi:hypothetical protein [Candidatus Burkholderia verschuerenii]|nr:hypothetical protein [Candidatus Burkholderia verschuerenii]